MGTARYRTTPYSEIVAEIVEQADEAQDRRHSMWNWVTIGVLAGSVLGILGSFSLVYGIAEPSCRRELAMLQSLSAPELLERSLQQSGLPPGVTVPELRNLQTLANPYIGFRFRTYQQSAWWATTSDEIGSDPSPDDQAGCVFASSTTSELVDIGTFGSFASFTDPISGALLGSVLLAFPPYWILRRRRPDKSNDRSLHQILWDWSGD
jgi:hypothetical protein